MIYHPLSLEATVARHCNNRCMSCSHASPWAPVVLMKPAELEQSLGVLSRFLRVRTFYCSGGEPLLNPDIVELLKVAKASGISDCVALITNARLLPKAAEELWQVPDFIRITVYPNLDRSILDFAKEKSAQYGFTLGISEADAFFKQFTKTPVPDAFEKCPWKKECWTIYGGRFFLCPQSAFFPDQFMDLPAGTDGLFLDESLTEEKLAAYINRKAPYRACEICLSYTMKAPWREAKTAEEWKELSTI